MPGVCSPRLADSPSVRRVLAVTRTAGIRSGTSRPKGRADGEQSSRRTAPGQLKRERGAAVKAPGPQRAVPDVDLPFARGLVMRRALAGPSRRWEYISVRKQGCRASPATRDGDRRVRRRNADEAGGLTAVRPCDGSERRIGPGVAGSGFCTASGNRVPGAVRLLRQRASGKTWRQCDGP
jgi:hypothetical protein